MKNILEIYERWNWMTVTLQFLKTAQTVFKNCSDCEIMFKQLHCNVKPKQRILAIFVWWNSEEKKIEMTF